MATYITLMKFTQKGVENIKGGPARLDQTKKMFILKVASLRNSISSWGNMMQW